MTNQEASALSVPTVHLNGTSIDELSRQLSDACAALTRAKIALQRAMPNARDYYVQADPDACNKARRAHADRIASVDKIREDLMNIYIKMDGAE